MQFILSLIMGISVAAVAGYIGSLMVTKRMALMGGALGHLALPGIAVALFYEFDVSLGALLFLLVGIAVIWGIQQITNLPAEAVTAVVFPSTMAITFLFLPRGKAVPALIGDISQITIKSAIVTIVLSLLIFITTKIIYKKLVLISISPSIAQVEGVNVKKYNLIYLICVAITVALGVRIVGGLMTAALVAIPATASKNISKGLFQFSFLSMLIGAISGSIGIYLFKYTGIAAGPLIIISSSSIFLISIFIKKIFN